MKGLIFSLAVLGSTFALPTPQDANVATPDIAALPDVVPQVVPTQDASNSTGAALNFSALSNATDAASVDTSPAASKGCADITVIFARGTTETGTVGTLAGPPFFAALEAMVGKGNVDVQGVPYPADIPGFLAGGSPNGSKTMAAMVLTALSACPSSKVVMSGYSQGGQLVHNAAKILPAATMAKVDSVVIFGDPDDGTPVAGINANQVKVICHDGDNICAHGDLVLPPHLTYSLNAGEAATFVAATAMLAVGNSN